MQNLTNIFENSADSQNIDIKLVNFQELYQLTKSDFIIKKIENSLK